MQDVKALSERELTSDGGPATEVDHDLSDRPEVLGRPRGWHSEDARNAGLPPAGSTANRDTGVRHRADVSSICLSGSTCLERRTGSLIYE